MKYVLNLIAVIAISLLSSCHKDDYSDPMLTPLAIHRQFKTEVSSLSMSELESFDELPDGLHIVNSIDELPDDRLFGTEKFRKADINFSDYSLIIAYNFIFGDVLTCKYDWCFNNFILRYQLNISLDRVKDSEYVDGEIDRFSYVRSAILVSRIPSDSRYIMGLEMHDKLEELTERF